MPPSPTNEEQDWHLTLTFDLDLNIDRGHPLIKDYLPTRFEAF